MVIWFILVTFQSHCGAHGETNMQAALLFRMGKHVMFSKCLNEHMKNQN